MERQIRIVLVIVSFLSVQAEATFFGIPDSDTAIQLQTYLENLRHTLQLGKIIAETRQVLKYAADTSRAANAAVRVVRNVGHFVQNPSDFLEREMAEFDAAFPEFRDTHRDVTILKESIKDMGRGFEGYDPYALQEALYYARKSGKNVYEIKARLMDRDGISSPHDAMARQLRRQKGQVDELFNDLERAVGLGITPQDAVIFEARAAAQEARAAVASAAHLNEMSRLSKIQFNNAVDEKVRAEGQIDKEMKNLRALVPRDLSLNPWGR